MKYVIFIHLFIKHFPKFPFLREKSIYYFSPIHSLKVQEDLKQPKPPPSLKEKSLSTMQTHILRLAGGVSII